jgi:hypothetical protein
LVSTQSLLCVRRKSSNLFVIVSFRHEAQIVAGLLAPQDGDRLQDFPHLVSVTQRSARRQRAHGSTVPKGDQGTKRGIAQRFVVGLEQREERLPLVAQSSNPGDANGFLPQSARAHRDRRVNLVWRRGGQSGTRYEAREEITGRSIDERLTELPSI